MEGNQLEHTLHLVNPVLKTTAPKPLNLHRRRSFASGVFVGLGFETALRGSLVVISRVISPLMWRISIVILLATLLITTNSKQPVTANCN